MKQFIIAFLLILGSVGLYASDKPVVKDGVLDLRGWDFNQNPTILLDGHWAFYWEKQIDPELFNNEIPVPDKYILVPDAWNDPRDDNGYSAYGYATYYLKIILDNPNSKFAISSKWTGTSVNYYVNGKLVSNQGIPGTSRATTTPSYKQKLGICHSAIENKDGDYEYNIVAHISNFDHCNGGLWDKVTFGVEQNMNDDFHNSLFWGILVTGLLFMIFLYNIFLFILNRKDITPFFFAMIVLMVLFRSLLHSGMWIYFAFPDISFELVNKLSYWGSFTVIGWTLLYFNKVYPKENKLFVIKTLVPLFLLVFLSILVFPVRVYSEMKMVYFVVMGVSLLYLIFHVIGLSLLNKRRGSFIVCLSILVVVSVLVNDALFAMEYIHTVYLSHIGALLFILIQEYFLLRESAFLQRENTKLSLELTSVNQNLEHLVESRTSELKQNNNILIEKTEELNRLQVLQKQMTGMVVHDLKAPLATLIEMSKIVKNPDGRFISMVMDSSRRMLQLVMNILDIQKLETANIYVKIEKKSVKDLIEDSVKQMEFVSSLKNVDIILNSEESHFAILDYNLTIRVLNNLLDNAIKHVSKGSSIYIRSDEIVFNNFPEIRISIIDNGPGVPEDQKSIIFNSFVSDSNDENRHISHGLGLSFCKMAMEAMSGDIGLETELGKGSTFYIDFPRVKRTN
jgi:two-component system sensor histidine kinase ChiS